SLLAERASDRLGVPLTRLQGPFGVHHSDAGRMPEALNVLGGDGHASPGMVAFRAGSGFESVSCASLSDADAASVIATGSGGDTTGSSAPWPAMRLPSTQASAITAATAWEA